MIQDLIGKDLFLILKDLQEAKDELKSMLLDSKFGDASATVVIEEFLDGIELSCFVLTDGSNYKKSFYGTISYMPAMFGMTMAAEVIKRLTVPTSN